MFKGKSAHFAYRTEIDECLITNKITSYFFL